MTDNELGGGMLVVLGLLYFLPTWIALVRSHHQGVAILLLNLLLGWTLLGWVAALVWSATAVPPRPYSGEPR